VVVRVHSGALGKAPLRRLFHKGRRQAIFVVKRENSRSRESGFGECVAARRLRGAGLPGERAWLASIVGLVERVFYLPLRVDATQQCLDRCIPVTAQGI
jgi:hypothetical protein